MSYSITPGISSAPNFNYLPSQADRSRALYQYNVLTHYWKPEVVGNLNEDQQALKRLAGQKRYSHADAIRHVNRDMADRGVTFSVPEKLQKEIGGAGNGLMPRMPTKITDRPDGMIPQVAPNMPQPSLQTRGVGEGEDIPGVSGRLRGLLSRTSPYMQRARTRALQDANRRGLMSSSIAQGAGEAAAIDAALPIAQADAGIAASERAMAHEARQAELQRQFAGRQAELDRETQRLMQDRGLSFEAAQAEASRAQNQQRALQSGLQHAQDQYQTSLDRLTANLDLPVEERHRMEEHYSYVYDEALRGLQALYGVDISWTPRQRPTEARV